MARLACWLSLIVAVSALAGCASPPADVTTYPLDAASPREALPDASELPAGFVIGWEQGIGLSEAGPGHARMYDHNDGDPATEQSLRAGAQRFPNADAAAEWLEAQAQLPVQPGRFERPDAYTLLHQNTWGAPDEPEGHGSYFSVFRIDGQNLAWATTVARGQPPIVNATDIVDGILAKMR